MENQLSPEFKKLRMWIIWAALLIGIVIFQFVLVGALPSFDSARDQVSELNFILGVFPVGISVLVRWFILPKLKKLEHLLIAMLIGSGLAEMTMLIGIFLIGGEAAPGTQGRLFLLSFLGIFQFMPVYLSKQEK